MPANCPGKQSPRVYTSLTSGIPALPRPRHKAILVAPCSFHHTMPRCIVSPASRHNFLPVSYFAPALMSLHHRPELPNILTPVLRYCPQHLSLHLAAYWFSNTHGNLHNSKKILLGCEPIPACMCLRPPGRRETTCPERSERVASGQRWPRSSSASHRHSVENNTHCGRGYKPCGLAISPCNRYRREYAGNDLWFRPCLCR